MNLTIPDDILKSTNLDERQLVIELACHLFDRDFLSLGQAARMAGMNRTEFEEALFIRKIPAYRVELEDFEADMRRLDAGRRN